MERSGGIAAIVCDTTGNTVRQGYCYTCLAIGGGISVGSLRKRAFPNTRFQNTALCDLKEKDIGFYALVLDSVLGGALRTRVPKSTRKQWNTASRNAENRLRFGTRAQNVRVGVRQNGFCADFVFLSRRISSWSLSPVFFSPRFCGELKCAEKSSKKIAGKILQNLYIKHPRQLSAEGPELKMQHLARRFGLSKCLSGPFRTMQIMQSRCAMRFESRRPPNPLKHGPTSLNKEVGPCFLGDKSMWRIPSVSSPSDYSIWKS